MPVRPMISCVIMRHSDCSAHALPLNDHLFQEPFYVTHAGWEQVLPHQSYPRPGHPSYYSFKWDEGRVLGEFCLSLITSGQGELQTKQMSGSILTATSRTAGWRMEIFG